MVMKERVIKDDLHASFSSWISDFKYKKLRNRPFDEPSRQKWISFAQWQVMEIASHTLTFVYPRGNRRIGGIHLFFLTLIIYTSPSFGQ